MGEPESAPARPPGPEPALAAPPPPPPPAPRSRRRRRLLVLCLLATALLAITRVPILSAQLLELLLGQVFHRRVSVGAVRYSLSPLQLEVLELRVDGPTAEAPAFLLVPRIEVLPSLAPLWERRLVLSRLRVESPIVRINALASGGDDIPAFGGGGDSPSGVRINRLVIDAGEVIVNHERVPLSLDMPGFTARLARRGKALAGSVTFGPGPVRLFGAAPLDLQAESELVLDAGKLTIESGRLRGPSTDLACQGVVGFTPGVSADFTIEGDTDLGVLDRHVLETGFGLRGATHYSGSVGLTAAQLRLHGRARGTAGMFDGTPVPSFDGEVVVDAGGLHLRQLALETLGGRATLDVEVPRSGSASVAGPLESVDMEALAALIFDVGPMGLGARASGPVAVRWPRGRVAAISGTATLDLEPTADHRTPLQGRVEWSAEAGLQQLQHVLLATPETRVRLRGPIRPDRSTDLEVDAESTDLALTDALGVRVRNGLGVRGAQPAGFSGSGAFAGHWRGTLAAPIFEGRFGGQNVGYLGVTWGRAEWAGRATTTAVASHSLVLRRPGGELWLDGSVETGTLGQADALDLKLRFRGWPAGDFSRALESDLPFAGLVSGDAQIQGRRSAPIATAHVSAAEGRYAGMGFTDLVLTAGVDGGVTRVESARAELASGTVAFRGSLSPAGIYDFEGSADAVDIGDLTPPQADELRIGGRVSGTLRLQGSRERPLLTAHLASPRLFLGDEGLGALEATLQGSGDGQVSVSGTLRSPRVDLAVEGVVAALPPYQGQLTLRSAATSVDPFVRALWSGLPVTASLLVTGQAKVFGPLQTPAGLSADAELTLLEMLLPDYPIRNREPVQLVMRDGQLAMAELRLSGEGTDLSISGEAALRDDGPLRVLVQGGADMRALSLVTRELRSRGQASLEATVSGSRRTPHVDGKLRLDGVGVRVRGLPHGIDDVRGDVLFNEEGAHSTGLEATLGGGPVTLQGSAAYAQGALRSFEVQGTGHGMALRYPEGLRSRVDADLRFFGDAHSQWVTGRVDVGLASWTRRYELASELLAPASAAPASGSLKEGLHFDIQVHAPGTLEIDNNLAALTARADLTLQGTSENPVVLGRAEIDKGRVYFQGNTYVIRRGTLDFSNPRKVDPLFDIEAETRLRSYRVTLKVNGTLERAYPTLVSDPPLSAVQILNLLAGADESAVASVAQSQTSQDRLAAAGAATLAAGRISEGVGLERGAERLLGLNRFSIDPTLVRGGVTGPTARLTVGKRLGPDVSVLYTQDLGGTDERLISLEYTLSDRLSILLTSAEPGGFGVDVRLRQSR